MSDSIIALADLLLAGPRCVCGHTKTFHQIVSSAGSTQGCHGPTTREGSVSESWGGASEGQHKCWCNKYKEKEI